MLIGLFLIPTIDYGSLKSFSSLYCFLTWFLSYVFTRSVVNKVILCETNGTYPGLQVVCGRSLVFINLTFTLSFSLSEFLRTYK